MDHQQLNSPPCNGPRIEVTVQSLHGIASNKSRLFAWTVGIGEGACFLTYWTTTYRQLYICRAITGLSLGGALPLIYSVLGDLFSADERHSVNAIVGIGTGLGISIGQGVAGFLGPTFGWRLPFLVVSIPALMCAVLVLFTVQDPERGGMEQAVREHRRQNPNEDTLESMEMAPLSSSREKGSRSKQSSVSLEEPILRANEEFDARVHWKTFWSLLSTPTVVLSLLQGAPGCVPWGIVNTYLNDFLSENRGMTVEVRIGTTSVATETSFDSLSPNTLYFLTVCNSYCTNLRPWEFLGTSAGRSGWKLSLSSRYEVPGNLGGVDGYSGVLSLLDPSEPCQCVEFFRHHWCCFRLGGSRQWSDWPYYQGNLAKRDVSSVARTGVCPLQYI
jgi:hypothetical protein